MALTDPKLRDFGSIAEADPLIPTAVLAVLLGFCIALFREIRSFWGQWMDLVGLICGALYLIGFILYLAEYYDRLWLPHYLLPIDRTFFRLYSIVIGIFTISLMPQWPQAWYVYILVLFVFLYYKKKHTLTAYSTAFRREYEFPSDCPDNVTRAKLSLAQSFTTSFGTWGVGLHLVFSVILGGLYLGSKYYSRGTDIDVMQALYIFVSVILTVAVLSTWAKKITNGLREMASRVERGDYGYFEK